jgi:hypothetical protein
VLLQGFFTGSAGVQGVSFIRHRRYPSRPRRCHAHVFGIRLRSVHLQEVLPCVEPPSLGPFEAIGAGSPTSLFVPLPSLRGTEGEVSATPIEQVANCGFLVELLSGDPSGCPCPFNKGWLVVRRLIHESAHVGMLGRAQFRPLGTEGTEALPRWDPSTSCPR